MGISMIRTFFFILFLSMLCSCDSSPEPSSSFDNQDIFAAIEASYDGVNSVEVTAHLKGSSFSNTSYLQLSKEDAFITSVNGDQIALFDSSKGIFSASRSYSDNIHNMSERGYTKNYHLLVFVEHSGKPEYFSIIPTTSKPDRIFVSLERSVKSPVRGSVAEIPDDFEIISPISNSTISRTQNITLQWSNSGKADAMVIETAAVCEQSGNRINTFYPVGDAGIETVNSSDIFPTTVNSSETCDVNIILKRVRNGNISSGFGKGGYFNGINRRNVIFISQP